MAFPATRLRRLRKTGVLRDMVRETELSPKHLVYPMFVELGTDSRTPIESMPGVERLSISHAVEEAGDAHALGIPSVLLFGIPAEKDEQGSGAYDDEGVVQLTVRAIKDAHPEAAVIGVEPELAADARDSLRAGEPVAWPAGSTARTIADALRVEQVGELTLAQMRAHVDGIVTVSEDEIRAAIRRTARDLRLVAEPGGVVAIAAYLFKMAELPQRRTYVAVLSGGNIAPDLFAELMAQAPR